MNMLLRPVRSSLGSKYLMAISGLALSLFVLAHMGGNLLIFLPGDSLNNYADSLHHNGGLLWTVRFVLLALFLLHIVLGIRLTRGNFAARPIKYVYEDTARASWASRHMLLTGLLLLAFVLYHLAHFTFGALVETHVYDRETAEFATKNYLQLEEVWSPQKETWIPRYTLDKTSRFAMGESHPDLSKTRPDVRLMVISGFRTWWISLTYLIAMVFLWLHLWHGISSLWQSLGISHLKYRGVATALGPIIGTIVLIGNCSMPLSIWLGLIK